jgi:hypothetical protein
MSLMEALHAFDHERARSVRLLLAIGPVVAQALQQLLLGDVGADLQTVVESCGRELAEQQDRLRQAWQAVEAAQVHSETIS